MAGNTSWTYPPELKVGRALSGDAPPQQLLLFHAEAHRTISHSDHHQHTATDPD